MADTKQFSRLTKITKGNTPSTDLKMTDIFAMQHIDLPSGANAYKQVSLAQSLCEPIAVTPNSTPSDGAYTATCSNYPDFSLTYTDANGNSHYLIGLKVRVVFTKGITYGSVSGGTYPTLNINGSGAIPLLAQGMTMAKGAAQNGQTIEFTIIPYGNGVAFDADSNVRESTTDYTIYTDGLKRIDTLVENSKDMITSGAVNTAVSAKLDRTYLETFSLYKSDNNGYPSVFLLFDVTSWYNGTGEIPVAGLIGTIYGHRPSGGNQNNEIYQILAKVGYGRNGATLSDEQSQENWEFTLIKIKSRSTTSPCRLCIVKDANNKYYLALIGGYSLARRYVFIGLKMGTLLGTAIHCTSSSGDSLPSGYSYVYKATTKSVTLS